METLKIEITVPKEGFELATGIGKFLIAVKAATADGWQIGQDLPVVMAAALGELMPAIQGFEKVGGEVKEDPLAFGQALVEGLKPAFL